MSEHDGPIEDYGPNEDQGQIGEGTEAGTPDALRDGLSDLFGRESEVPGRVDRAVARASAEHFGAGDGRAVTRRRIPAWRWGGLAAAASVAFIGGVVLWGPSRTTPVLDERGESRSVARTPGLDPDLNRDGSVDVLDALILAKAVDAGGEPLDLTGDGATSAADVEALTQRIVTLRRRG